jgi:hypothetical protein
MVITFSSKFYSPDEESVVMKKLNDFGMARNEADILPATENSYSVFLQTLTANKIMRLFAS